MSQPDTLAQLAAATEACPCIAPGGPVCFHCGPRPDVKVVIHGAACLNCQGENTVPLVPGLRFYANLVQDMTGDTKPIGTYTVVSGAAALLVLLEWACEHWKDHHGTQADVDFTYYEKAGKRIWVAIICCGHASFPDDIEGEGESALDALAAAVAQARGLEVLR